MDILMLLLAGAANFTFIGLKAFQQLNVVHDKHLWVMVVSHMIAVVEVYVVVTIAQTGYVWQLVLTIGTSGGLGALFAMYLHKWLGSRRL